MEAEPSLYGNPPPHAYVNVPGPVWIHINDINISMQFRANPRICGLGHAYSISIRSICGMAHISTGMVNVP